MLILQNKISAKEIKKNYTSEDGFIKGVVDIEKELVALDAEMH